MQRCDDETRKLTKEEWERGKRQGTHAEGVKREKVK